MKNDITEQNIKVFTEAVSDYFSALGDDPASIRTFYLACDEAREAVGELTGTIALSGDYRGAVHFAAPRAMLRYVLNLQKTTQVSDELLLDAVGEIANTLAGNARRRFGSSMNISVPSTRAGGLVPGSGKQTRERQFVVMIDWKHYTAILVVDIAHA